MNAQFFGKGHGRRKQRGDNECPTDPVRSHSWDEDDWRAKPGRPIGDRSAGYFWAFKTALVDTLNHELDRQREDGHGDDPKLQLTCVRVLERALTALDRTTGDFFISYAEIASRAKVGRTTAIRAIHKLEKLGFLAHVRRSRLKEGMEGQPGAPRAQAPNAYYFDCQARMSAELWKAFYKRLRTNLEKVVTAAKRRAALILQSFNSKAMPAPRPSDPTPLQMGLLAAMKAMIAKNTAEGQPPSAEEIAAMKASIGLSASP